MSRLNLIDKDALLKKMAQHQIVKTIRREPTYAERMTFEWTKGDMYKYALDAPSVDAVEVVHGEWIGTEYDGYADGNPVFDVFECSVCGMEYDSDYGEMYYNYCPSCGAKMDGGNHD